MKQHFKTSGRKKKGLALTNQETHQIFVSCHDLRSTKFQSRKEPHSLEIKIPLILYLLFHSFNNHIPNTYSTAGTAQGAKDKKIMEPGPTLLGCFLGKKGRQANKSSQQHALFETSSVRMKKQSIFTPTEGTRRCEYQWKWHLNWRLNTENQMRTVIMPIIRPTQRRYACILIY